MTIYTIGHSTRSYEALLALLKRHDIEMLADVRSYPGSRKFPWFGKECLHHALRRDGVAYLHSPNLGGRRKALPESANLGWRSASFRGYADHMQTPEFTVALNALMLLAADQRVAYMCSEAVPWRCHRSLISDALTARGVEVVDILDVGAQPHRVTPFACFDSCNVTYPKEKIDG